MCRVVKVLEDGSRVFYADWYWACGWVSDERQAKWFCNAGVARRELSYRVRGWRRYDVRMEWLGGGVDERGN